MSRRDLPAQAEGNRRLILSMLAVVVLGSAFSVLAATSPSHQPHFVAK